jgi:NCS2 family nucleobase:cation symporter-2
VGSALHFSKEQMAFLINADLLAAGIVTVIQSLGVGPVGIRLPIMMGVTFAAVSPMIAIAQNPEAGMPGLFGAIIASGVFGFLVAPLMSRLIRLFPPVVNGAIICLVGLSLLKVGINWSAGGEPTLQTVVEGRQVLITNPAYGALSQVGMASFVLVLILAINRFGRGLGKSLSVLMGLVIGTAVSWCLGKVPLDDMAMAPWFHLTTPFYFGAPTFHLPSVISMCLVMLIVLAESLGLFLVVGNILDEKVDEKSLTKGFRADGLGAVIGGILNTFPYTSFSQNIGLLTVTQVRGRHITALGGLILITLGLLPKLAVLAASIPSPVLGGAGLVMFGMVAATGIRILGSVDFDQKPHNALIIAVTLTIGMIPTLAPGFFHHFPAWSQPFTHSGIVLGAVTAMVLNFLFNGLQPQDEGLKAHQATAHSA